MIFKVYTSLKSQDILLDLKSKTNITPNILARYAISISLKSPNKLQKFNSDNKGLELNRQILTGSYDSVYKALIEQYENIELSDEEYFPKYIKAHFERGIVILNSEYEFAGNTEKFILAISNYEFDQLGESLGGKSNDLS